MQKSQENLNTAYADAQTAIALLKSAVRRILSDAGSDGLRNADIGRALGIYAGHVKHVGHISRTLLSMMEAEGLVQQDKETKIWTLNPIRSSGVDLENDD